MTVSMTVLAGCNLTSGGGGHHGNGDGGAGADGGAMLCGAAQGSCEPEVTMPCDCKGVTSVKRCAADGHAWESCEPYAYGTEIYISPTGDDEAAGTIDAPFATLERAQVAERALVRPLRAGGVVVWLRGGTYVRSSTFSLTALDAGTSDAPVVFRGYPGETARITGGTPIDAKRFLPVTASDPAWTRLTATARDHVFVADLGALGITSFGDLGSRESNGILELFVDATRMPLARWPDAPSDGSVAALDASFARVASVVDTDTFSIVDDRMLGWGTPTDAWVHAEFAYAWLDSHNRIASVDAGARTISLVSSPSSGVTATSSSEPSPFYVYNLLEELTTPGEWYLDRATGRLYFWPTRPLEESEIVASTASGAIVSMTYATQVTLQELTLEASQVDVVDIVAGDHDAVVGCTIRNGARTGVSIYDGSNDGLDGDLVYGTGSTGVDIAAGDRPTLTPGGMYVRNSDLFDYGHWDWMYRPGIALSGVGNSASHNLIHDSPHAAILFGGNDNTMELNEIHDVCKSTSDAGAIYSGRDWGARGNVIQNNYIHDIHSWVEPHFVMAIYLDDCLSGITARGNLVANIDGGGFMAGGGRDNHMDNNIVTNAMWTLLTDARCTVPGVVNHTPGDSWDLLGKLEVLGYQADPWLTRYPACASIPDDYDVVSASGSHWLRPEGSTFTDNVGWQNTSSYADGYDSIAAFSAFGSNLENQDPEFVDPQHPLLGVKPTSPLTTLTGFEPIPFAEIGIQ